MAGDSFELAGGITSHRLNGQVLPSFPAGAGHLCIPPYLLVEEERQIVNYARTRIGERNVLLAQQADLHLALETPGEESYDRLDFTHCRAFFTESTVRFEPDSQEPGKEPPPTSPP